MAELNKMGNGRPKKDGQQPLLDDDSDSEVQEFAMQSISPRSRRPRPGVRTKRGGGGGCCRNCIRLFFLLFNLLILGCVGYMGYRGWLMMKDIATLKQQMTALSTNADELQNTVKTMQTDHGALSQRLSVSQTASNSKSGKLNDQMTGLKKSLKEVNDTHQSVLDKIRKDLATVQGEFQQSISQLNTATANGQSQSKLTTQSALSQLGELRSTHAKFEEGVRQMNESMRKSAADVAAKLESAQSAMTNMDGVREQLKADVEKNMGAMQASMDTMEADMTSMSGKMAKMGTKMETLDGAMNSMTTTVNVLAAEKDDRPVPTLAPLPTEPQVALETVQELNASFRYSFQKLVTIVKSEHENRVNQQKNISKLLRGVQDDVIHLIAAVHFLNGSTAQLFDKLINPPTLPPTEPAMPAEIAPTTEVVANSGPSGLVSVLGVSRNVSLLMASMQLANTKIGELVAQQQELNNSLIAHRVRTAEQFSKMDESFQEKTNISYMTRPEVMHRMVQSMKAVDVGPLVKEMFDSDLLVEMMSKVNLTAMLPAIMKMTSKMQPIIEQALGRPPMLLHQQTGEGVGVAGTAEGDEDNLKDEDEDPTVGPTRASELVEELTGIQSKGKSDPFARMQGKTNQDMAGHHTPNGGEENSDAKQSDAEENVNKPTGNEDDAAGDDEDATGNPLLTLTPSAGVGRSNIENIQRMGTGGHTKIGDAEKDGEDEEDTGEDDGNTADNSISMTPANKPRNDEDGEPPRLNMESHLMDVVRYLYYYFDQLDESGDGYLDIGELRDAFEQVDVIDAESVRLFMDKLMSLKHSHIAKAALKLILKEPVKHKPGRQLTG